MIGIYELIVEDRSGTVALSKLPSSRIRGLLGESLLRYSRKEKKDIYNSFFKPRFKPRPILNKIPHPKPYFIAYPSKLFGNVFCFQLRVMGYMNEVMNHVFNALKSDESRLRLLDVYVKNDLTGFRRKLLDESPPEEDELISFDKLWKWVQGLDHFVNVPVKILFITPFKLTKDGNPITITELKASDVLRFTARRLFLLDYLYYSRGVALPFRLTASFVSDLVKWCDEHIESRLYLTDVDFKIRDEKGFKHGSIEMSINGETNTVHIALFLLKFGTYFGIGKKTAYGMGHYELTIG